MRIVWIVYLVENMFMYMNMFIYYSYIKVFGLLLLCRLKELFCIIYSMYCEIGGFCFV